ncbi:ABC transporter substrate-binding protein [Acinetobacter chinensis]|uniref:ABC transporter substrate-binding protein n=1 Tax=Acinetobacter chinensis TaxID=2004650 RepID=UPI002934653A|nr:ABC transporter substrate-binding protein [Acinetobacter chinensis]WOE41508.1 ABC transporter substrate-binding protein [Acinetobacter chinensis]
MLLWSKILLNAAVASSVLLAAAPLQAAEEKPGVIRLASPMVGTGNRPVGYGNYYATTQTLGLLEKEFQKDGIKIQWNNFKGAGPAINESYANGLVDITWLGDLPALIGKSSRLDTRLVAVGGTNDNTYLAVPTSSTAKSIADLKGKRIGFFKGTNLHLSIISVIKKYGLSEKDFRFVNMDGPVGYSALASGDIDAIWSNVSIQSVVDRGIAKIIYNTKQEPDLYKLSGYVLVNSKFEQKYPETVQRVVNVLVRQAAWESQPQNKAALFKLWSKSGLPYNTFVKANSGIDLKRHEAPILDAYNVTLIKQKLKAGQDLKLIRGNIDVDSWIEPKYVNSALKSLNLQGFWTPLNANGK